MKDTSIILAAGGTGGHIFPAQALAAELRGRGFQKIYLVTDARFKKYCSKFEGVQVLTISTGNFSGGIIKKIIGALKIIRGFFEAHKIITNIGSCVVIGFGGYPSFPTMAAAVFLKKRTIIHEQNAFAGEVNKQLSRFVSRIATSYPDTHGFFDDEVREKISLVGNPVRPEVRAVREKGYPELTKGDNLNLLITGGSQGAAILSRVVPAAIELLPDDLKKRLVITQQCRAADVEGLTVRYTEANQKVEISPFFGDMDARLSAAHLVICRAGASSIAELMAAGRPAIFVPFAAAKDNHQMVNALFAKEKGMCEVLSEMDFTPEALASLLKKFMNEPETLKLMAKKAHDAGGNNAASDLADVVEGVIKSYA